MRHLLTTLLLLLTLTGLSAQTYTQVNDISYTGKTDSYAQERLKLDVYYPEGQKDCPVIIWFHGGGLEAGNKEIPARLKGKGWVVVGVNYRLLPKVTIRETLDDAAEAVAWVFRHAADYGGDTAKIVVTGHSAGGYIGMMLCLNKAWLAAYDIDADDVMMYVPFSGQAVTHYNVRKMQGLQPLQVTIDEFAPIYWVRPDCPPLVLICGDRELELYGRYDENQYLARMMKLVGHKETYLYEIDGHGHSPMVEPSFHILETHLNRMLGKRVNP
ncbi:MAG: alpha/beta hydrolase [Bacteroidales bacterium]|jgi:Esterase/lipase|nr:alpha/beta hydrolase [Bacteroidales bacterium]